MFAFLMGTNVVLTVVPLHHCVKVDCRQKNVWDGTVSHDFQEVVVIRLEAEIVQASKLMKGSNYVPTFIILLAVPAIFVPAYCQQL